MLIGHPSAYQQFTSRGENEDVVPEAASVAHAIDEHRMTRSIMPDVRNICSVAESPWQREGCVLMDLEPQRASIPECFRDRFQFGDNIHGQVQLNNLERDAIDSPEFQRLFRIAQLGLVDITYQNADHTRGAHSIGTCHTAQLLLAALAQNRERRDGNMLEVSIAEKILVRLGALLHDIPHGPFSHDIERKKHLIKSFDPNFKIKSEHGPFEKHDDYSQNAAFSIAVFDTKQSVLARILSYYSKPFWELLRTERAEHLRDFIAIAEEWPEAETEMLPQLLFHLFAFEDLSDAQQHTFPVRHTFDGDVMSWHLGPDALAARLHRAWYQPFRHEIIGNTLSADLMDYLARDCSHLHIKGGIDDNLLRHYVLTKSSENPPQYRCAIDLYDHKRGIIRTDRLNDIFQMLEIRHTIHEKAVYHRMAQSALAMLSRAIKLGQAYEERQTNTPGVETPSPLTAASLYGFNTSTSVALHGDEHFLGRLVTHKNPMTSQLSLKLAERRLFRPLMILPGHRVRRLIPGSFQGADDARLDKNFRELAAIMDAPVFAPFFHVVSAAIEGLLRHEFTNITVDRSGSAATGSLESFLLHFGKVDNAIRMPANHRVIFWTLPYKQLFKDPAIVVTAKSGPVLSLDELYEYTTEQLDTEELREFGLIHERVKCGIRDADVRYSQLWKIYVFISDGLFYGGSVAKLISDPDDYAAGCAEGGARHLTHLESARDLAASAIKEAWEYWNTYKGTFHGQSAAAEQFLLGRPDDHMMNQLIGRVLMPTPTDGASEVRLEQYQHGEGESHSRCRDIRYRFERPEENKPQIRGLLEALGVQKPFFGAEAEELFRIIAPDAELVTALGTASPAEAARMLRERIVERRLAAALPPREDERPHESIGAAASGAFTQAEGISAAREAIAHGNFVLAKELLRIAKGALPEGTPDRQIASDLYDAVDTGKNYDDLLNVARQNYRRTEYAAAERALDFLAAPEKDIILYPLLSTAHVLRAEIHVMKNKDRDASRDLDAAEAYAGGATEQLATIKRLRGNISWRARLRMVQDRQQRVKISGPPPDLTQVLVDLTDHDQEQLLTLLEDGLAATTRDAAYQRSEPKKNKTFSDDDWRALYERFTNAAAGET